MKRPTDENAGIDLRSESRTPILSLKDVTLSINLGQRYAKVVENVSFVVEPGQIYALVGESGSGKSVIARAVMGLMPSTLLKMEGKMEVGGRDRHEMDESELRILRGGRVSMIFQDPMTSLNPLMRVADQITEAIKAHKGGNRNALWTKALSLLGDVQFAMPDQIAKMYPHELSGGMRQRVMIAMALANSPELLIADEPTTALDVTIQQEIMEILIKLRDRYEMSVLLISHDLSLIDRYADKIGVLYGGVMMEQGPTKRVVQSSRHPYTRALLNCIPRSRMGEFRQNGIEGSVPSIVDWYAGCRFAPRCRFRKPSCELDSIPTIPIDHTQEVKCRYPL